MTMTFDSLAAFRRSGPRSGRPSSRDALGPGPTALVVVEDEVELGSTLAHLSACGFDGIAVFAPADIALPDSPAPTARITTDTRHADAMTGIVNAAIEAAPPGTWLHPCYNAEYLFYPFHESRTVGEMLAFHAGERRDAMLCFTIDLYAPDLARHPGGVDRATARIDRIGYHALARLAPDGRDPPPERQLDFFGGLRWRFEEHAHPARRRIDRIGLFRALPGLRLLPDGTLNVPEMNTHSCAWHHNLTAAICSFRAAKALRANPISRDAIESFVWRGSAPFAWTSRQLLDLGLMEPGQWT